MKKATLGPKGVVALSPPMPVVRWSLYMAAADCICRVSSHGALVVVAKAEWLLATGCGFLWRSTNKWLAVDSPRQGGPQYPDLHGGFHSPENCARTHKNRSVMFSFIYFSLFANNFALFILFISLTEHASNKVCYNVFFQLLQQSL